MANTLNDLEIKLDDIFGKKAPELPKSAKDFLVQWAPIITLVVGVLGLLSAISLWNWAHHTVSIVDLAQSTCVRFGGENCAAISSSRLSFWLWLSLLALIAESVLYLLAYPGLKARSKKGWDYIYYASLVSVALSVVRLFSGYNPIGNFIGALLGAAIGFYFLFQLRSYYAGTGRVIPTSAEPEDEQREPMAAESPSETTADEPNNDDSAEDATTTVSEVEPTAPADKKK